MSDTPLPEKIYDLDDSGEFFIDRETGEKLVPQSIDSLTVPPAEEEEEEPAP
jgi:hypothetical protein